MPKLKAPQLKHLHLNRNSHTPLLLIIATIELLAWLSAASDTGDLAWEWESLAIPLSGPSRRESRGGVRPRTRATDFSRNDFPAKK